MALGLPQGFSTSNYQNDLVNNGGSNSSNNSQRQRMQPQDHSAVHVISDTSISIHSTLVSGICNFCDTYFPDLKAHGINGHMIPAEKIWSVYLSKSCTISVDASVIQSPGLPIH